MLSFFSFLFIFQIFSTACPKKQLEEEEEEEEEGEGGGEGGGDRAADPNLFGRTTPRSYQCIILFFFLILTLQFLSIKNPDKLYPKIFPKFLV